MNQFCVVALVSLVSIAAPLNAIAIPSPEMHPWQQKSQTRDFLKHHTWKPLISLEPSNFPVVSTEDWRGKDAKLPWNQLVMHKTPNAEERVVFTKSYKFKTGWLSGRKERIHARWTQNNVELSIMAGFGCSWAFGCESGVSYAPPKQIKVTVNSKDYFLTTVDQNTYGLTPELKQAIAQTSDPLKFRVDERIKFEVKEEAIPVLKQLFTLQEPASISSSPSSGIKPSNPML